MKNTYKKYFLFIGLIILFSSCSGTSLSNKELKETSATHFTKVQGKLEFKLIDDSISDTQLAEWVDKARQQNKIADSYDATTLSQLNRILKGKIPAEDDLIYELHYNEKEKIDRKTPFLVEKQVGLSGDFLNRVEVVETSVAWTFNSEGAKKLAELMATHINKRLAIIVDGVILQAPVIKSAITDGKAKLSLYTEAEAKDLADALKRNYQLK